MPKKLCWEFGRLLPKKVLKIKIKMKTKLLKRLKSVIEDKSIWL